MVLVDSLIATATVLCFISLFKNMLACARWLHATSSLVFELASKGCNLGLISWNPSKLEATSSELRDRFGATTEVKTGVADLTKLSGEEIAAAIAGATEGINVGLLVNNAGSAYPYPRCFHEVDRELMESMLRVNVNAALWATKGVIDGTLKRKRGAIFGSGSSVCIPSFPLLTLYASTKVPPFIATKMIMLRRRLMLVPSPEMFSRASVRWIGYERQCNPYWLHAVQGFVIRATDAFTIWYGQRYLKWMRQEGLEHDGLL
ncbi:hypothetical protein ACJRO7_033274 [Eucalyptus globulus]|uniref:Uncharacterized protein n=1 Tax=Eucalyptus globulus TaxID=34317 RepID=A0ABD3JM77_EUCGL